MSSCLVRGIFSNNVYLTNKDRAAHSHCDSDDRKIHACKIEASNANVLSGEDIPPEETGQGGAECRAERTIVDPKCHAVDRCPKCPVADGGSVNWMDLLPCLNYAGKEDGGTDIGASKLKKVR